MPSAPYPLEPDESGWIEIQWWRVTYTHGDERKAGPWRGSKEAAAEWARKATNVSEAMRRTVRYENAIVGAMTPDVAEVLLRGENTREMVGQRRSVRQQTDRELSDAEAAAEEATWD